VGPSRQPAIRPSGARYNASRVDTTLTVKRRSRGRGERRGMEEAAIVAEDYGVRGPI
jgi:hypothetical protein